MNYAKAMLIVIMTCTITTPSSQAAWLSVSADQPASPCVPHPDSDMTERFMKAHAQRLTPPANCPDFQW
jgi:hypothetical protein